MGLPEQLGETTVAQRGSSHIHLPCDTRRMCKPCLFWRRAPRRRSDRAVIRGSPGRDRILSVIHHHVCHSLPNRSLVVTNTCLWQGVVLS